MRVGSSRRPGVAGFASTLRLSAALAGHRFGRRPCSVAGSLDRGQRVLFALPGEPRARMSIWQRVAAVAPALVSSAIGARTRAGLRAGWTAPSAFSRVIAWRNFPAAASLLGVFCGSVRLGSCQRTSVGCLGSWAAALAGGAAVARRIIGSVASRRRVPERMENGGWPLGRDFGPPWRSRSLVRELGLARFRGGVRVSSYCARSRFQRSRPPPPSSRRDSVPRAGWAPWWWVRRQVRLGFVRPGSGVPKKPRCRDGARRSRFRWRDVRCRFNLRGRP